MAVRQQLAGPPNQPPDRGRDVPASDVAAVTTETLPVAVPLEPTTPIKPSEAIRLGCLIAPVQGGGGFFNEDGSVCALGAMALGYGLPFPNVDRYDDDDYHDKVSAAVWDIFEPRLPETLRPPCDCPTPPESPFHIVAHMNDLSGGHHWSRERIADWLAEQGL